MLPQITVTLLHPMSDFIARYFSAGGGSAIYNSSTNACESEDRLITLAASAANQKAICVYVHLRCV